MIATAINRRIFDFVQQPPNERLRPGTGAYSTPFRGSLFGLLEDAAVAKQLRSRRAEVLWLGANPCMARSLDSILSPPRGAGDFPAFVRQMESPLFSSARWDEDGNALPDFNPIERATGGWVIYCDMLKQLGSLDAVAMANVLPWGSQDTDAFLTRLEEAQPALLGRVLAFADDINLEIVRALRPRLLVVPISIGRNRRLDSIHPVGLAISRARERRDHRLIAGGRMFRFHTAICERGAFSIPTVYLPHPASLRLSAEGRTTVVEQLSCTLREAVSLT